MRLLWYWTCAEALCMEHCLARSTRLGGHSICL